MQEGWLGDDYWILFSTDEALEASRRYRMEEALPGGTLIGLVNWDDLVVRDLGGATYAVPTVPISREHQRPVSIPSAASLEPDDRFVGKVKWYVTPLVFGGDPEAGENLSWVAHDQHAELVLWWNTKYREIRPEIAFAPRIARDGDHRPPAGAISFLAHFLRGRHPLSPLVQYHIHALPEREVPVADVDTTMMKVQRLLTGPMGLRIQLDGNSIAIQFTDVSTRVNLAVQEWGTNKDGDPQSLVRLSCPILWEVPPSPALYEWVATEGGNFLFGHVSAHADSTSEGKMFLVMSHTLLGDYLDEEELSSALWAVLGSADKLDDELKGKFGGKRLADFA